MRLLLTLTLALALLVGAATPTGAPVHYEDEPGWNCQTMGNHICGEEH